MRLVYLTHAVSSCWNNGNAHFLRGVLSALRGRGVEAIAREPEGAWSRENLRKDHGEAALSQFTQDFPQIDARLYAPDAADPATLVEGADVVIVHEWNEPALVNAIGRLRANGARFTLLFHDTHHRAKTAPHEMARFDLSGYDGVLAFGEPIAEIYRQLGWGERVWVWHEAADTRLFHPRQADGQSGDLVWVGNWGDEERSEELREFLLEPTQALGLEADVFGVRYPEHAQAALAQHGVRYRGWLANAAVPEVFARYRVTVHVPRRPYAKALPGIPTIRVFEALACGIPLVSAPWEDTEGLFPEGAFLMARNGEEMRRHLRAVLDDAELAESLRRTGLQAIRDRHTCDHRAGELLGILAALAPKTARQQETA